MQLFTNLNNKNPFLGDYDEPMDLISPCNRLTLAGDLDYFNTAFEAGHDDDALRSVAGTIYFRRHMMTDSDITALLMPARHPSRSPNYELTRNRIMRWQNKFQSGILSWVIDGVTATCEALGGSDFMETTTLGQRRELWGSLFNQSPVLMAQGILSTIKGSVPVDDIFSGNSAQQIKWQTRQHSSGQLRIPLNIGTSAKMTRK